MYYTCKSLFTVKSLNLLLILLTASNYKLNLFFEKDELYLLLLTIIIVTVQLFDAMLFKSKSGSLIQQIYCQANLFLKQEHFPAFGA